MSNIQIVNSNDQLIGHKDRSDIDYQKDIYRSTCLWIENSKGEVLLAQRKLTKDKDPGKWGPAVAGTVDQGETYESNIAKEAEEEIGLKETPFKPLPKLRQTTPRNHFIQTFYAKVDKPLSYFKIQEEEVEQLAWISKGELLSDISNNPNKYVPSMTDIIKLTAQE